jgi:hypothetical protein
LCAALTTTCAQIHWFSIINSCVTVLLLTGFLATILMRVLKADFVKYTKDEGAAVAVCWRSAWRTPELTAVLACCSGHRGGGVRVEVHPR